MLNYKDKFVFIAGPCAIENERLTFEIASFLKDLFSNYNKIFFVFKASFDKANRTSIRSERGVGIKRGIKILEKIKEKLKIPILSDIHCREQVKIVKDILDIIQIPAFLCRQTDLILEAAKTKKTINIKKGQFLSPYDIKYVIEKIESVGNKNIFITERGSCFGYNNLVVDFRSFLIMRNFGYPVIYDATHSLQRPSAENGISGGDRDFILPMALAATAIGIDGIFMEVHPEPKKAISDRDTSFPLKDLKNLIEKILKVRECIYEEVRV